MTAGRSATCRHGAMCISGRMGSISRRAWSLSVNKSIRGIDFSENDRQCMLVIIGADEWGNKDVLGLIDGFRESTQDAGASCFWTSNAAGWRPRQSWQSAMVPWGEGMTATGPKECPNGPHCMRFMARPGSSAAGCTTEGMTATGPKECPKANVLNAMPKSVQPKAKAHLKELEDQETIRGIVCPNNGWPKPRPGPMPPSISSSRLTA